MAGAAPSGPRSSPARRLGRVALLALGARLARRGVVPTASIGVVGITTFVAVVVAIALASRGRDTPLHAVPLLASGGLAWGGGFLLAVAASAHALLRDRAEGVRHLFVARTSLRSYVFARVGGLAALLVVVVGGGTLVTGLASTLAALHAGAALRTLHATAASLVYAIGFAAVVAPVTFVAMGARGRLRGYLVLLAILVVPEAAASALDGVVPTDVTEVLSIPSALAALRGALSPGTVDVLRFVRALVAVGVIALVAVAVVRRSVTLLDRAEAA